MLEEELKEQWRKEHVKEATVNSQESEKTSNSIGIRQRERQTRDRKWNAQSKWMKFGKNELFIQVCSSKNAKTRLLPKANVAFFFCWTSNVCLFICFHKVKWFCQNFILHTHVYYILFTNYFIFKAFQHIFNKPKIINPHKQSIFTILRASQHHQLPILVGDLFLMEIKRWKC